MKQKTLSIRDATELALRPLRAAGTGALRFISIGKTDQVAALYHEGEGVGFDLTFLTPFDLGKKVMNNAGFRLLTEGILPEGVQATLGVNSATNDSFVSEVFRGIKTAARALDLNLRVGNSVQSPTQFFVSLLCTGTRLPQAKAPRPGFKIALTGFSGQAVAGLHCLRRFGWTAVNDYPEIVRWHLCPSPPIGAARMLVKGKTNFPIECCIDGLAADLFRFCEKYKVGAKIVESQIPVSPQALEASKYLALSARRWALYGPEDFGLLAAIEPRKWLSWKNRLTKLGCQITEIGEIQTAKMGVSLLNLEGESVRLANRSWNTLVRRKTA